MRWLLLWSCAALALAASRVPYDDEWFSLDLAFRANRAQFWDALAHDVHPPWVALIDRAVAQVCSAPIALQSVRVAVSLLAIAILARALSSRLGVPRWAFALAAAHPLLLFYSGAVRWYPFLLLAHALRAYAIWHADVLRPSGSAAFAVGGALGSMASYVDPLFLAHDCGWLIARTAREKTARLRAGLTVSVAVAAALALRLASPLQSGFHRTLWSVRPRWDPSAPVRWAAMGIAGETALPWPLLVSGAACVVATGWAFVATLRARQTRVPASWLGLYAVCWLVVCCFGAWQPRYSPMLWLIATVLVVRLALRGPRAARIVCTLGAAHLAIGLTLAATGRGSFKADLNGLSEGDCAVLAAADRAPLLVVPYARLAVLAREQCAIRAPILTLPSVRVVRAEEEQLSELRAQLPRVPEAWVLSLRTDSSIRVTESRVRALLTTRCRPDPARLFGTYPHRELRQGARASEARHMLQRWSCDGRTAPP